MVALEVQYLLEVELLFGLVWLWPGVWGPSARRWGQVGCLDRVRAQTLLRVRGREPVVRAGYSLEVSGFFLCWLRGRLSWQAPLCLPPYRLGVVLLAFPVGLVLWFECCRAPLSLEGETQKPDYCG